MHIGKYLKRLYIKNIVDVSFYISSGIPGDCNGHRVFFLLQVYSSSPKSYNSVVLIT